MRLSTEYTWHRTQNCLLAVEKVEDSGTGSQDSYDRGQEVRSKGLSQAV